MTIRQLYVLLKDQVLSEDWWPAETNFEIIVGAILTQNTAWTNVVMSIDALKEAGLLDAQQLLKADNEKMKELIRLSGSFNAKARYLKEVSAWYLEKDQDAQNMDTNELRQELLKIHGIGPETADDILLYVYDRPVFIYDLYARRLLKAAGFGEFKSYQSAKIAIDPLVEKEAFSTNELAEYHGLIVDAGKIAREHGGWEKAYTLLKAKKFGVQ